ncbi:arylamine N-acetyltransferase family protein [Halovivax gelatinilyticus]|uniref:arylamine N-acetyltransferase family protein n=1 Tax=Halovivax gelatinilyticus TaxID=2961597 RepID=UPI0020CA7C62|nr:arylamine N-acetyltransferase [Halovivax gelatinilyticus]
MNAADYLDRIGIAPDGSGSDNSLETLQRRHLRTVPFTNVYVDAEIGTTLDPETAVERVISGGGGLCYDLNTAYAWLLSELGYDVDHLSARPRRDDGTYGPEYDHLALLVDDRLIDVGFGDFARTPLPLDGSWRRDVSGTYRIVAVSDDRDECTHAVEHRTDGEWAIRYRFDRTPRLPTEFAEMADFHANSPDSHFAGDRLATLATADGRRTLSGTSLTITEHGSKRKRALPVSDVEDVLAEEFGIDL